LQKNPQFRRRVVFFAIDEAHCVETWGRTFRKAWGELGLLRSFYRGTPIMALSATFSPKVLQTVKKTLKIRDRKHTMIRQLLNRPNIFFGARRITGSKEDRADLAFLLSNMQGEPVASLADIPQAIIFHDTVSELEVTRESLELRLAKAGLPKINKSQRVIEVFHRRISTARKEELQKSYSEGHIRILCATEAFALGVDIPTIQRAIIYRVVNHQEQKLSLEMIMQHLGRAGRDPRIQAVGVLFYEPWCFGEIASYVPGKPVKAENVRRKITGAEESVA